MSQPNSTSRKKPLRLDDLQTIANKIGGRLQISIVPKELVRPWWWQAEQWLNSNSEGQPK